MLPAGSIITATAMCNEFAVSRTEAMSSKARWQKFQASPTPPTKWRTLNQTGHSLWSINFPTRIENLSRIYRWTRNARRVRQILIDREAFSERMKMAAPVYQETPPNELQQGRYDGPGDVAWFRSIIPVRECVSAFKYLLRRASAKSKWRTVRRHILIQINKIISR